MNQLKRQGASDAPAETGETGTGDQSIISGLQGRKLTPVSDSQPVLYDRLSPIRCFNYHAQLCVAGRLITESLEAGNSAVLLLDKNAEQALDTLETMGFALRQALLERNLDIYYYRRGVRDRTFFKKDYQTIFDEVLKERFAPVQHVVMIEFNTLFANRVRDAVTNQIEDFCAVARGYDVSIWGLYCPPSWSQNDFLSERLPTFLGKDCVKQARTIGDTGNVELSVRKVMKQGS